MNVIWRILVCAILVAHVSAKNKTCKSKIVGGYAAGVSGMPPIDERSCENDELRKDKCLSNAVECARTCRKGGKPKTCYYKFVVERYPVNGSACELCTPNITNSICANCQCVPGNGVQRMGLIVNRMLPGPSIQVCLGDRIVVDVLNNIKEDAITIHWHGIYQKNTQYYDGVPMVTQCPIVFKNTFRYQFDANNSGSHFWHAHTGLNKMDGIQGSLIIREPTENEPNRDLYNFDLANHVIFLTDWMNEAATERSPGRNSAGVLGQFPDSILINGKGRSSVNTPWNQRSNASLEVITVEAKKRYRFRLINSFCTICPVILTIERHNLTVIATDGIPTDPVTVTSIISFAAERYDFVIHTNQEPGAYWIQARLQYPCVESGIQQLAVLQYLNASTIPMRAAPTFNNALPTGIVLNPIHGDCRDPRPDAICISDLRIARANAKCSDDKDIGKPEADVKLYMAIGFNDFTPQEFYHANHYRDFSVPVPGGIENAMLGNITFAFPPSPPLSQLEDLPQDQFCNAENMPTSCNNTKPCTCTHVIKLPLNSIVEIVLVDESRLTLMHPIHLHGHSFRVLSMGRPLGVFTSATSMSINHIKQLDENGELERNFNGPPGKDTIPVPDNGFAVIRFRTNNPGFWLLHCHFVYHHSVGMELVLNMGSPVDWPPVPPNFPKCGNFMPPIRHKRGSKANK
ncbi:uncharacterized protein LOC128887574 [Hylaeus anthracinus]|uniref:uncharacterized protein LOC128887574 n=1 Tax=Hylaeus anthracinus TaxID=313031 RepID=UPI0023B97EEB|nr:uncharacterized protein LOC128887574 [Hylaeus anthracinus]